MEKYVVRFDISYVTSGVSRISLRGGGGGGTAPTPKVWASTYYLTICFLKTA